MSNQRTIAAAVGDLLLIAVGFLLWRTAATPAPTLTAPESTASSTPRDARSSAPRTTNIRTTTASAGSGEAGADAATAAAYDALLERVEGMRIRCPANHWRARPS